MDIRHSGFLFLERAVFFNATTFLSNAHIAVKDKESQEASFSPASSKTHTHTMTSVESKTVITLKGSVEIVSEFFFTAINSILYQRGEFRACMKDQLEEHHRHAAPMPLLRLIHILIENRLRVYRYLPTGNV